MRAIPGPETVLVSVLPPSPNALTKSTIFVLGRLFNVEGQVFDPNEYPSNENMPQDRLWRGGYIALETDDGGLYFGVPPSYGRATQSHRTGSILDVRACISERIINPIGANGEPPPRKIVTVDTGCMLPPVEIGRPWEVLPNAGSVHELLAVRTGDTGVIPEGGDLSVLEQYPYDKLLWRLKNMLLIADLGKTAFALAVEPRIDAERAQSAVNGSKSRVGEPEQLVLMDI